MIRLVLFLLVIFVSTSCGQYIDTMHREFDRSDQKGRPAKQRDTFAQYRYPDQFKSPSRLTSTLSTRSQQRMDPQVKREYKSSTGVKKRLSANDLNDNSGNSSLWAGTGKDNNLYAVDTVKGSGDIILLNVMAHLKNEITMELKRQAPPPKKKKDPAKDKPKEGAPAAEGAAAAPKQEPAANPQEQEATDTEKVYDKISTVVIEEVQKEHLLLRGLKNILFNNQKHLIEVQALVSRRDVGNDDSVSSEKVIEYSIQVVR